MIRRRRVDGIELRLVPDVGRAGPALDPFPREVTAVEAGTRFDCGCICVCGDGCGAALTCGGINLDRPVGWGLCCAGVRGAAPMASAILRSASTEASTEGGIAEGPVDAAPV